MLVFQFLHPHPHYLMPIIQSVYMKQIFQYRDLMNDLKTVGQKMTSAQPIGIKPALLFLSKFPSISF